MANHELNHQCLCGCHNDLRSTTICENCGEQLTDQNNKVKAITLKNMHQDGTMKKRKIYIAGKVTGEDKLRCVTKFQKAEMMLRNEYELVYNPIKLVSDFNAPWRTAMLICLRVLINDLPDVYFLKDWQKSKGARAEMFIAQLLGLPIHFEKKPKNIMNTILNF